MTDRSTLPSLLARVKEAKGSDRDLNVALYAALREGYPIAEEIAERQLAQKTSLLERIRKQAIAAITAEGRQIEKRYGWRVSDDDPPEIVLDRKKRDIRFRPDRVAAATREVQAAWDRLIEPAVELVFVWDEAVAQRKRERCDCPGCAPLDLQKAQTKAGIANAIRHAGLNTPDRKQYGVA